MTATLTPSTLPSYVNQVAPQYGIDPAAALAVFQHEGTPQGLPGDNNTSFGPWQLHIGGSLPSSIAALGPQTAQQWAWSTDGVNYALQKMASVGASGKTGYDAVQTIVAKFEISADIPGEIANAWTSYAGWLNGNIPVALSNVFVWITGGGQRGTTGDGGEVTDGQGNPIVVTPAIPGTISPPAQGGTTPSPGTGGASNPQDVRLGQIGPFKVGIPSGLVLGLMGMGLLALGVLLFIAQGRVSIKGGATQAVTTVSKIPTSTGYVRTVQRSFGGHSVRYKL